MTFVSDYGMILICLSYGTVRQGQIVGIIQAFTVHICIFQVPCSFNVNKLCSDKTKICLDIGPALLVSEL